MGIFDNVFNTDSKAAIHIVYESEAEAMFAILFVCINTDSRVTYSEDERFVQQVTADPDLSHLGLTSTMGKMMLLKDKYGLGAMVQAAVKQVSPANCNSLFAKAIDLMLADGVVAPPEQELLETLMQCLNISGADAMRMVDAAKARNAN